MSRPRLKRDLPVWRGVGAAALFVVLAYVGLTAPFGDPAGFGEGSITASIGHAMFNMDSAIPAEGFLAAFEIVDVVLVAALVGAVMLARRDVGGRIVGALRMGGDDE